MTADIESLVLEHLRANRRPKPSTGSGSAASRCICPPSGKRRAAIMPSRGTTARPARLPSAVSSASNVLFVFEILLGNGSPTSETNQSGRIAGVSFVVVVVVVVVMVMVIAIDFSPRAPYVKRHAENRGALPDLTRRRTFAERGGHRPARSLVGRQGHAGSFHPRHGLREYNYDNDNDNDNGNDNHDNDDNDCVCV
jgi:hypothetical protein